MLLYDGDLSEKFLDSRGRHTGSMTEFMEFLVIEHKRNPFLKYILEKKEDVYSRGN